MAFADPAQNDTESDVKSLRQEIGQYLLSIPKRDSDENLETIGLRESFAIWELEPERFQTGTPAMPFKPSAFRHYQVYINKEPRAHAVVQQIDGASRIYAVEVSTLAQQIDRAIDWIDTQDKDENPVRYVIAGCCSVHAFQLVDNDVVYVVATPSVSAGVFEDKRLSPEVVVSTTEFLKRLRYLYDSFKSGRIALAPV
jgi:hypothetical protein